MSPLEFLTKISYGVTLLKEDNPNVYVGGVTFNFKCLSKVRECQNGCLSQFIFQSFKSFFLFLALFKHHILLYYGIGRCNNGTVPAGWLEHLRASLRTALHEPLCFCSNILLPSPWTPETERQMVPSRPFSLRRSSRAFSMCKVALSKCNSHRGDCMGANSCAHSLSHPPWEFPAFFTCHACRSPSGKWPSQGSSLSQWLSNGGAYRRVPTPHARIPRELGFSLVVLGVWLESHLSLCIITVWGAEAWGLHTSTVPPPTLSPSTVPPPPRLSLPVGIRRGHFSGLPNFPGAFIMLSLGDARGRLTPEVVDLKETPSCPAVLSSGSLSRGPTMLTLVNARGLYGTQAPQSRADNLFIKETMASPYHPTWHPVTGKAQCTEVTPSCSYCNQQTRGPIVRLGLNVACASQVYIKSFKIGRSRHCSITCTCSYTLHLLPWASLIPFLQNPKLSLINHQRYDFYALIALYSWFHVLINCLGLFIFLLFFNLPLHLLRFPVSRFFARIGFFWTSRFAP